MLCPRSRRWSGFTLVELLVVLAIIGALIALLLPAVIAAHGAVHRARCQSNLHQLGIATQNFHDTHGTMPTYFGVYPPSRTDDVYPWWPSENLTKVYGGWLAHLLPFIEQDNLYDLVYRDVQLTGHNQPWCDQSLPGGGGGGGGGGVVCDHYNGHDYCYATGGGSQCIGYHAAGIWIEGAHQATYRILQCPADPTLASDGEVYSSWGSTNYLANFNAWGNPEQGLWSRPVSFATITDGLSNTVLFGEGFANCDRIGRIGLYSWFYHNFGLDWYNQANTLMFQDRPLIRDCDNWRAQSGHTGGINACLADGSTRVVSAGMSQATWSKALLPRDGEPLGSDW